MCFSPFLFQVACFFWLLERSCDLFISLRIVTHAVLQRARVAHAGKEHPPAEASLDTARIEQAIQKPCLRYC